MAVSASLIEKVETGKMAPSETYIRAATTVLVDGIDATGLFGRLRQDGLRRPVISNWLRDWLSIEEQASAIRWFEPSLVPGLLQVESYAKALLVDDDQVGARLARQRIFDRTYPPEVVAILDEAVLHYPVGSCDTMAEQLANLATVVRATVHILPSETNAHHLGRDGSFVLATVGDKQYVYAATPARGFTLDDREVVSQVQLRWEALLAEALPQRLSSELITKAVESWRSKGNSG